MGGSQMFPTTFPQILEGFWLALEEKDVFLNHRDTFNIKTGKHCRGITIKQYSSGVHPEPMFSERGSDT